MVKLRCPENHEYVVDFPERKKPECDHKGDKVRGICVPCAMAATTPDPDPRCPECGKMPARVIEQPKTTIRIIRG